MGGNGQKGMTKGFKQAATKLGLLTGWTLPPVGREANERAALGSFATYETEQADNTIRRQRADLAAFAAFLASLNRSNMPSGADLIASPSAWENITWGLVQEFRDWQIGQGYAVGTVNVRLSTVKTYARLAMRAGTLSVEDLAMIRTVEGYSRKAARRVDNRRKVARRGCKKASFVPLTFDQADALKRQPDTPQGRRDAVIMAILLDHGLRVGELAGLQVQEIDLGNETMTFYRRKVDKTQIHALTADSFTALQAWLTGDALPVGPLLRASNRGGKLTTPGMSERSITERVRVLGLRVGVAGLSAHDCRHHWATRAARQGTDPFSLQEAGGWASLSMPRRYVDAARVANAGVKL